MILLFSACQDRALERKTFGFCDGCALRTVSRLSAVPQAITHDEEGGERYGSYSAAEIPPQ